jgi:hypothetical protein
VRAWIGRDARREVVAAAFVGWSQRWLMLVAVGLGCSIELRWWSSRLAAYVVCRLSGSAAERERVGEFGLLVEAIAGESRWLARAI